MKTATMLKNLYLNWSPIVFAAAHQNNKPCLFRVFAGLRTLSTYLICELHTVSKQFRLTASILGLRASISIGPEIIFELNLLGMGGSISIDVAALVTAQPFVSCVIMTPWLCSVDGQKIETPFSANKLFTMWLSQNQHLPPEKYITPISMIHMLLSTLFSIPHYCYKWAAPSSQKSTAFNTQKDTISDDYVKVASPNAKFSSSKGPIS